MLKTFEYRLYPNKEQKVMFAKHFGCSRFIYNYFLNKKIETYIKEKKSLSCFDCTRIITNLRKEEELIWLKEVNSQSLYQAVVNLDKAFTNFFRNKTGRLKPRVLKKKEKNSDYSPSFKDKLGFPEFKSKRDNRQTFACPQHVQVDFENNKVKLPKIKQPIKCIFHREFVGTVKTCTIKKTPTDKYFISILVETPDTIPNKPKIEEEKALGIDLGIKEFAIFSNGEKVENPKFLREKLQRLKVLQRRASKKTKGSNRQKRAYKLVALLHEQITNRRKDFLHKLSYNLTHDNQVNTLCLEALNVDGMLKNHKLAKCIQEVSWSKFNEFLEYKSEWYGKNILKIGQFQASSKICSICGYVTDVTKDLNVREWTCPSCNSFHDRDINAAINIKRFALQEQNLVYTTRQELPEELVESSSVEEAMKREAPPFRVG